MAFASHEKVVFIHIIICEISRQFPGLLIMLINTTKDGKWQMFLAKQSGIFWGENENCIFLVGNKLTKYNVV